MPKKAKDAGPLADAMQKTGFRKTVAEGIAADFARWGITGFRVGSRVYSTAGAPAKKVGPPAKMAAVPAKNVQPAKKAKRKKEK